MHDLCEEADITAGPVNPLRRQLLDKRGDRTLPKEIERDTNGRTWFRAHLARGHATKQVLESVPTFVQLQPLAPAAKYVLLARRTSLRWRCEERTPITG